MNLNLVVSFVRRETLLKSLLILTIKVTKERLMFSFSISQARLKAGDVGGGEMETGSTQIHSEQF